MNKLTFHFNLGLSIVILSLFFSCTQDNGNKKKTKSYLPVARGADGVILVVMDSALWADSLGAELKKSQSNAMRHFMTDESLKRIQTDSSIYRFSNQDSYAKGQEILHLFGQSQDQLISKIISNRTTLRNHFLTIEKQRISETLFKKEEKNVERVLENDHDFTFKIPYGFDLAKNEKDFVWVRFLDPEYEKNVFVYFAPYTSKEPFDDPVEFRESITSKKMRDVEKPDVYMTTQDVPHQVQEVNFNGKYAKETRGLWKLSDISGGGAFVSYVFVDESQKRMYYLEGYAYAPSKDKREFMREIEVILSTFKSGKELK